MQAGGEATDDAAPDVAGIRASWLRRTRPALPRLAEYVTVFFAAAVAVALLVIRTDLKTMGTAAFADPGWDRHLYIEMARRGLFDFRLAPYCWRILEPALAAALPFDLQTSFMTVTFAALVGLGAAVYGLVRTAGFSRWHGLIAMLLFFSLGWGPKFVVSDFWVSDALGSLFVVLALNFALRKRPIEMAVALAVGVLAKESVLFVAPLFYTLHARSLFDWRRLRTTLLVIAPAVVVLVALRLLIPEANGDGSYIATMPPVISRFPEIFPPYSYIDRFNAIGRDLRWGDRAWGDFDTYITDPFGIALLGLTLIGTARKPMLALRLAPFVVLVYSQLLFATDTQRLIVLAFPALALLAMPGLDALASWLRVRVALFLPAALALFALVLLSRTDYGSPLLLQAAVLSTWFACAWCVRLLPQSLRHRLHRVLRRERRREFGDR